MKPLPPEKLPRDPTSRRLYRRRRELFLVQGGKCYWCAGDMELEPQRLNMHGKPKHNHLYASFEHLIPKSMGGLSGLVNVVLAHSSCNNKRHVMKWDHDPVYGRNPKQGPVIAMEWRCSSTAERRPVTAEAAGSAPASVAISGGLDDQAHEVPLVP